MTFLGPTERFPWRDLRGSAKEIFAAHAKPLEFSRGDRVYRSGEQPQALYFVERGIVGLVLTSSGGMEHLLRLFVAGDYFGHRALFADEPYHADSVCLEPTLLLCLGKEHVERILNENPALQRILIRTLARELGRAELLRISLTEADVISRVASALVYLKELHSSHNWTRQEIANFCASTTPSVVRAMAALEARGFIRQVGRKVEILDREALLQLDK
jgi:CRP-like cAMP-binding protein